MTDMIKTHGIDHLGITVQDLSATVHFFTELLGWSQFGGNPDYPAAYLTDGTSKLTVWQVKETDYQDFNRHKNIGLHHFALKISSREELLDAFEKVKNWPKVKVEFTPEFSGKGPKEHFMIREPGGTRLEFSFDPR
ncbi:VOC family protein [Curvivirga sp.]|uniref:VOC family protein n=1 Tax=Curvivirga sp. TaxID=2856848 RepID=UPI003B5AE6FC